MSMYDKFDSSMYRYLNVHDPEKIVTIGVITDRFLAQITENWKRTHSPTVYLVQIKWGNLAEITQLPYVKKISL